MDSIGGDLEGYGSDHSTDREGMDPLPTIHEFRWLVSCPLPPIYLIPLGRPAEADGCLLPWIGMRRRFRLGEEIFEGEEICGNEEENAGKED